MSKTTFLGYVPSLKSKHEATIVGHKAIKSKGGSIRYTLQGEYDGRKTLPKTVSKADFESVYGFDAKAAEAVIIAGYVEDAKGNIKEQGKIKGFIKNVRDNDGYVPTAITHVDNPNHKGIKDYTDNHNSSKLPAYSMWADTVGNPSPASVEPPAPSESPFPQEPSNENFSAFGFGKKDEESEEPKTQEFTVVLQEGDKLELTDITEEELPADDEPKEEDSPEESENEEKEAELLNESAYNEQVALLEKGQEVLRQQVAYNDSDFKDFCEEEDLDYNDPNALQKYMELYDVASLLEALDDDDQDRFWELRKSFDAETYEAVQAKVTRPVKEDETEEESEEGLSTGAKVALGVGALAAGVALFGAEEYPQEFLDEFYDFDSNPTADTQDEETLAIAYAAWKYSKENTPYEAETDYTEIYGASVNVGEKRIMSRKDYDIDNELSGFSNMEIGDVDLDDYEDEITDSVEDEITEAIRESVDDAMPISDGESISSSVNVDTEIEITVPISGDIDYDWTANETYEDERHDDEWNAEHESESDGYAYAYTKGHNDGINDEVIYRPSLATDKGRNIYKKILKQKAENFSAEPAETSCVVCEGEIDTEDDIGSYTQCEDCFKPYHNDEDCGFESGIYTCITCLDWIGDNRPKLLKDYEYTHLESYKKKQKAETFGAESHRVFYSVVNTDTGDEIDYGQMVVEAPSMKEALEKAQIMLDKNAYVGEEYEVYPNGMRVQAESFEAEKMGWDIKEYGNKEKYASKDGVEVIIAPISKSSYQYHPRDAKWKLTYGRETPHGVVPLAKLFGTYGEVFRWLNNPPFEVKSFGADTIGNPSPSGPSSTPEPAEATGSEPSNENMESEGSNMKMALGILGVGVGAVALLGGDRIQKLFDRLGF